MKSLFRTKSHERILSDAESGEHRMPRTLDARHLTMLGVGAVIGAGIFVLTGHAAASYAGPAIALSFVLSAFACVFAALCYAEFSSMIPVAGSAYTYAYATLGELFAWVIGWDLILEYLFGAATVAVGWSGYVTSFLHGMGIVLPDALCHSPLAYDHAKGLSLTGAWMDLPAALVLLGLTVLLTRGVRESANFNNFIVVVKVIVILLFIAFGVAHVNTANWTPFIPENTSGRFGEFGWTGILRGAGVVFFAYIGFDAVSTAAQEAKNPQRDMPRGILWSLAVCAVLYMAVSLVITGLVPYPQLKVAYPMAAAIDAAGDSLRWLAPLIKLGAIAGLSSVILVLLLGQTRIFYSMAKDRLLPARFGALHPRFRTPSFSTRLTGVCAALIAAVFPIDLLGEMVSIGALLAFMMVCAGVLVMRRTRPEAPRPFRTPWVPAVPVMGVLLAALQMFSLPSGTWVRLVVWMAIGFVVYCFYGRRKAGESFA